MSDLQHALSLWRSRQSQAAELEIKRILLAAPEDPAALRAMAEIYSASGRQREAAEVWGRLARILPADASVLRQLAQALLADGAVEQAVLVLMRAVEIDPDNARGFNNLGLARLRAGDPIGAVASLERAVAMDPSYAIAHMNLGMACEGVGRRADARASYQECLRIDPYLTPARLALSAMLRTEDPTASRRERDRALETHAINLMTQRRHDEAIPLWDQLIAEGADIDFLHGMRFHCQLYCCDWSDYDDQAASLTLAVKRGSRADLPFSFLVHSDDPDAQLRCSQIFVAARHPRAPQVVTPPRAVAAARLRIGYLSFDFHEHATAYLIAGLLEAHDRAHFETIALSYGLHGPSPMRVRLEGAVDRFVDLKTTSDEDAAERIRELGIHILVDLKGFTGGARTGILARQPAPVQVNFLGYPGTMGADYVQYLVADRLLIQNVDERHYAEAVIFMPACYQPNDSRRPLPAQVPPRSEFGLPEHGFVFCCFNNLYKITPPTFDSWLDLLLRVPASVLWLLEGTQTAMHRLRSMAQSRGVASTRVVFAPHVDLATHLARYRHADLFLDTLPCNAHTTASDALWMGVPIVTLTGSTFAGRVTTSLLHAVGLPQLCTQSREAYVALALRFARNPADLAAVKTHLESGRHAFRLFDSAAYCRDLERAYRAIWKRHVRGEPPARLDLAACEPEA